MALVVRKAYFDRCVMIAFLPVSRFLVRYEIASGRPYSKFEQLVLEAIGSGAGDLDSLESEFRMHRSVLVGAVVTLVQAGLAGIQNNHGRTRYAVTSLGQTALDRKEVPENKTVLPTQLRIVMDRV